VYNDENEVINLVNAIQRIGEKYKAPGRVDPNRSEPQWEKTGVRLISACAAIKPGNLATWQAGKWASEQAGKLASWQQSNKAGPLQLIYVALPDTSVMAAN